MLIAKLFKGMRKFSERLFNFVLFWILREGLTFALIKVLDAVEILIEKILDWME